MRSRIQVDSGFFLKVLLGLSLFFGLLWLLQLPDYVLGEDLPGGILGKKLPISPLFGVFVLLVFGFGMWKIVYPWIQVKFFGSKQKVRNMRAKRYFLVGLCAIVSGFLLYLFFDYRLERVARANLPVPDKIIDMAFNQGGSKIAVSMADGSAAVYDALDATKSFGSIVPENVRSFRAVAYTYWGEMVAAGDVDGTLWLWSGEGSGFKRQIQTGHKAISKLLFGSTKDNLVLVVGNDRGEIGIYELDREGNPSPEVWWQQAHDGPITALALDSTGSFLATGGKDHELRVFDIKRKKELADLEHHSSDLLGLAFTDLDKNQVRLLSASQSGKIVSWDLNRDKLNLKTEPFPLVEHWLNQIDRVEKMELTAAAFSPVSPVFATAQKTLDNGEFGKGGEILIRHFPDGCVYDHFSLNTPASFVGFDPFGTYLMIGEASGQFQIRPLSRAVQASKIGRATNNCPLITSPAMQHYQVYAEEPTVLLKQPKGGDLPSGSITDMAWNLDAGLPAVALISDKKTLFFCDSISATLTPQCQVFKGARGDIHQMALYDDAQLMTVSDDGFVRTTGSLAQYIWSGVAINAMAVDPAHRRVVLGNAQGDLRMWSWEDSRVSILPRAHTAEISALVFSADGTKIASADKDGRLLIWQGQNFETQTELRAPEPAQKAFNGRIQAMAFSPDGTIIAAAAGTDNNVRAWNINGAFLNSFSTPKMQISHVIFGQSNDPTKQYFAVTGDDEMLYVFNAVGKDSRLDIETKSRNIMAVAINPDNELLTAAPEGNGIQEWSSVDFDNRTTPGLVTGVEEWTIRNPISRILVALLIPGLFFAFLFHRQFQKLSGDIAKFHFAAEPEVDSKKAKQYVNDVREGKSQLRQAVRDNEVKIIGALPPMPGGPGQLTVHEGYAAVLERNGRISRIVGAGTYFLEVGEMAEMAIPLYPRMLQVQVAKVLTRDQVRFENIKVSVRYHVAGAKDTLVADAAKDTGLAGSDKDKPKPRYTLNEDVIRNYIWNPEHTSYDKWLEPFVQGQIRDLIGQEYFEDIYTGSGGVRKIFRDDLLARVMRAAENRGLKIDMLTITEIELDEKLAKAIQDRKLAELKRQVDIAKAVTKRDAEVIKQDARAALRDALLRQIADPLRDKNRGVILDATIAVRYIDAIEKLSMTFIKEELGGVAADEEKRGPNEVNETIDSEVVSSTTQAAGSSTRSDASSDSAHGTGASNSGGDTSSRGLPAA